MAAIDHLLVGGVEHFERRHDLAGRERLDLDLCRSVSLSTRSANNLKLSCSVKLAGQVDCILSVLVCCALAGAARHHAVMARTNEQMVVFSASFWRPSMTTSSLRARIAATLTGRADFDKRIVARGGARRARGTAARSARFADDRLNQPACCGGMGAVRARSRGRGKAATNPGSTAVAPVRGHPPTRARKSQPLVMSPALGFVRFSQPLGVVRVRRHSGSFGIHAAWVRSEPQDGPALGSPCANSIWEFYLRTSDVATAI